MNFNQHGIFCDDSELWSHSRYIHMSVAENNRLSQPYQANDTWFCCVCSLPQFSDSFFDEPSIVTIVPSDVTSDTVFTAYPGLKLAHLDINNLLANWDELRVFYSITV